MKTNYYNFLYVTPDQDFNELAHKGRAVECVLVPLSRKKEFLKSVGYQCLYPLSQGKILYYED